MFKHHHHAVARATRPAANESRRSCGHTRHVGTCPCCQRAQLDRWQTQLRSVPVRAEQH